MHLRMEISCFKKVYGKLLKIFMLIFIKKTELPGLVEGGLEKGDLQGASHPK